MYNRILEKEQCVIEMTPPSAEYIHLPGPHPARGNISHLSRSHVHSAIYGFALYVCSCIFFAFYLIWSFVPTTYLDYIGMSLYLFIFPPSGLTYVPAKYWAVAVPLSFPLVVFSFVFYIAMHNIIAFDGYSILEDVQVGGEVGRDIVTDNQARLRRTCRRNRTIEESIRK